MPLFIELYPVYDVGILRQNRVGFFLRLIKRGLRILLPR